MMQLVPAEPDAEPEKTDEPVSSSLLAKEWERVHELRRRAHKLRLAAWPWEMPGCGQCGVVYYRL